MTVEEMKRRKKELCFTNEMIAERSGVPLGTVQKIFAGFTGTPRFKTMAALEKVLGGEERPEEKPARNSSASDKRTARYQDAYEESGSRIGRIGEEALSYGADPKQGSYTVDDYYALSEDRRVELIDGWIYDMATPVLAHQAILGQLHLQLAPCVEKHPECELFFAPADVRLDNDDRTMVQPDLYIVCGRKDKDRRRLNGAPDFVIEILSPSTRVHDMFLKLNKYRNAGVREYWIIDPDRKKITVYDFEHEELPETYTFHETVPVSISGGECAVDFECIYDRVERYFEN